MTERLLSRREMLKTLAIGAGLIYVPGLLSACYTVAKTATLVDKARPLEKTCTPRPQNTIEPTPTITATPLPERLAAPEPTPRAQSTAEQQPTSTAVEIALDPTRWKEWPVVPKWIHPKIKDIYNRGVSGGTNNPHVFSKAGDCENIPTSGYLFGKLDKPGSFNLGEHGDLAAVIKWFSSSWSWFPPTVHGGQNAAGILVVNPLIRYDNNHQKDCLPTQSYLECEVEQRQPSLLLISYEQELQSLDNYKKYLNMVVGYALDHNIVPIVTTCANSEAINGKVAEVAFENSIPMWNFWRAVQPLKNIFDPGLHDGFHLSWGGEIENFDFSDPHPTAWNIRNLTGVEAIKAVLEMVNSDFRAYEKNF